MTKIFCNLSRTIPGNKIDIYFILLMVDSLNMLQQSQEGFYSWNPTTRIRNSVLLCPLSSPSQKIRTPLFSNALLYWMIRD